MNQAGMSEASLAATKRIIVGRITGVYGVKGWLKVFSYTDPMEAIVDYRYWYIGASNQQKLGQADNDKQLGLWRCVQLEAGKRHAKTVVVKLENCDNRDAAMAYIGSDIAIEEQQLVSLKDKNEYYWRDLIGLRVINQQNIELGIVTSLLETGANDVLVVTSVIDSEKTGSEQKEPEKTEPEKTEPEEIGSEKADVDAKTKAHQRERLIPWTINNAIIAVDLERQVIEVDWDADF